MISSYKDYHDTIEAQPHFEEDYVNGVLLLTGAGEMIELGQLGYGLGRFEIKKVLQRGIVTESEAAVNIVADGGMQFTNSTLMNVQKNA